VSGNGEINKLTGTGCVSALNHKNADFSWQAQRYGEYSFQFIDYNLYILLDTLFQLFCYLFKNNLFLIPYYRCILKKD
jgi:hypothetical protein